MFQHHPHKILGIVEKSKSGNDLENGTSAKHFTE